MNRSQENAQFIAEMIAAIQNQSGDAPVLSSNDITANVLIDISRSLAVIADAAETYICERSTDYEGE